LSLGRIGLVGSLGKKTNGNIALWNSDLIQCGAIGTRTSSLAITSNGVNNDDRDNIPMPLDGEFNQLYFKQGGGATGWLGLFSLQKNNITTGLEIDNLGASVQTIQKITVKVPFVAGDLFRWRTVTNRIAGARLCRILLLGGFKV